MGLVDKLIEYGVLEEGTTITGLDVKEDDCLRYCKSVCNPKF